MRLIRNMADEQDTADKEYETDKEDVAYKEDEDNVDLGCMPQTRWKKVLKKTMSGNVYSSLVSSASSQK